MPDAPSSKYPAGWSELTWQEKRARRFDLWRQGVQEAPYASPEAKAAALTRVDRLVAAYNVREPDRVPVSGATGLLPFLSGGLDYRTNIYEPAKSIAALEAFNREHAADLDTLPIWGYNGIAASALDILGTKVYAYPGHGMPMDSMGFQYVEGEYMRPDEYDAFIRDPSDFWLRTYLPRVATVFEPLAELGPLTDIVEINTMQFWALERPDVQAALQRLLDAGKELARYRAIAAAERDQALLYGFPPTGVRSHFAKAPFDTLADTLRGTRQIIMDMFRQPDKLLQAVDVVTELTITSVLGAATPASVGVAFPLHKGADGWMSEEQFLTFYWPALKRVIEAFVAEGLLVILFAEGSYSSRLDLVNEFPKGAVAWEFDRTDMAMAKAKLGQSCCIAGNVPASLLVTGSADEVETECRRLIDTCAPGGGYILAPGAIPECPKLENLKAMARVAREHGLYAPPG